MVGRGSCRPGRWMNSSGAMFTVVAVGSMELVPPTVHSGTAPMLPGPVWGHISGCTAAHPAQVAAIQHIYFISTQVLFCSKIGLGDISQEMYLMHIFHAAAERGKNCMFWW